MHSVCVTSEGKVLTWGCNDEGALGRPTPDEDDIMVPGEAVVAGKVVQVSAGDSHTAALTDEGSVFVWGIFRNANGKLGLIEENKICETPTQIMHTLVVCKIVSGADHLVALTEGGDVYTMGCAEQGQLGRVPERFSQDGGRRGLALLLNPAKARFGKKNFICSDVWSGQYGTYAQESGSGAIYAWGLNNHYQLGFNDKNTRFAPKEAHSFSSSMGWTEIFLLATSCRCPGQRWWRLLSRPPRIQPAGPG